MNLNSRRSLRAPDPSIIAVDNRERDARKLIDLVVTDTDWERQSSDLRTSLGEALVECICNRSMDMLYRTQASVALWVSGSKMNVKGSKGMADLIIQVVIEQFLITIKYSEDSALIQCQLDMKLNFLTSLLLALATISPADALRTAASLQSPTADSAMKSWQDRILKRLQLIPECDTSNGIETVTTG
jgi:hypothetical protein